MFKKYFCLKFWKKNTLFFFQIFRVSFAENSGEVPSASAWTSKSYCVQVPMATSDHDYVVPQESDLSKLKSA